MKKFVLFVLGICLVFAGCAENGPNNPGPVGQQALLVDNCEDGNDVNLLGGTWHAYDDQDFALTGAGSGLSSYDFMDSTGCPVSVSGAAKITNQNIFSGIDSAEGGYYGFTGMYTTLPSGMDISSYTGIRFYAYSSVSSTTLYDAKTIHFSFALGSKTEDDEGVVSRYRKEFIINEPSQWQQIQIPFNQLTQGFIYDDYYGSHPQALTGVVKEATRLQWDMVLTAPSNHSQWSDVFMIDHVEIY